MNISLQTSSTFLGNFSRGRNTGLKSTQQKIQRQAKRDNQIAFWENQKENLKEVKCDSLEEIGRKLEKIRSYNDEIAAAKAQYNSEQMFHILDEAKERAEKLAKKLEEMKPKTAEERREDLAEKALESDTGEGVLTEVMEQMTELAEEIQEKASEEILEDSVYTVEEAPEESAADGELAMAGQTDDLDAVSGERLKKEKQEYAGYDMRI